MASPPPADSPAIRLPKLTLGLVGIVLGVYALELAWGGGEYPPTLVRMGANTRASLGPEPWRLLASCVLHIGPQHLLLNAGALLVVGAVLERILGSARVAIVFVVAGIGGSVASVLALRSGLSAGASGAIAGMLGALVIVAWRPGHLVPRQHVPHLRLFAFVALAVLVGASFAPRADAMAHLGGCVTGAALTLVVSTPRRTRIGAIVALSSVALALATSIVIGRPWVLVREPEFVTRRVAGFSVDVPSAFEVRDEGARSLAGDLLRDPIDVVIEVRPRAEELRIDLPAGVEPNGEVRFVTDAPAPTFEREGTYPTGLQLVTRHSLHADALLVVKVRSWPDTPVPWKRAIERLLRSPRPESTHLRGQEHGGAGSHDLDESAPHRSPQHVP